MDAPDTNVSAWTRTAGVFRQGVRPLVIVLLVVAAVVAAHVALDLDAQAARLRSFVQNQGAVAPPVFIALTAVGIMLLVPAPIAIGMGSVAFGQLGGALYSIGGITAGAGLAFLLGRYVLRDLGTRLQGSRLPILRALASQRGPLPVIALRFAFPFAPGLDYAVGATGISLPHFLEGTLVGLIPRTFALSFFFDILTKSDWLASVASVPALLCVLLMPLIRVAGIVLLVRLLARYNARRAEGVIP
ncbi:MAG: TVP38/TMEM64 family protein [Candidatus Rokubacteria bacterium]|nr:TVP38/TMEM64 family protein [Candidatus Rokubacteria bacterium]